MATSKEHFDIVSQIVKLCEIANHKNIEDVLRKLNELKNRLAVLTYDDRSRIQEILTHSEQNGVSIKQFLDKTQKFDRDQRIKARNAIFRILTVIRNNTINVHEVISHFLMKAEITKEAAKDLMEFQACYRQDKLAGQLVLDAIAVLSYTTLDSVQSALGCGEQVKRAAYLYLDPEINDPVLVYIAALIIDTTEPNNEIHGMLFYPEFLKTAVRRMQDSTFSQAKGQHAARQDSSLFHSGGHINFRLHSSLNVLKILTRSEGYRCSLHTKLSEEASILVLDSVFKRGTISEQKEASEVIRNMSKHSCHKHENTKYLRLHLTMVIGLETHEIPLDIGGNARHSHAPPLPNRTVAPIAECILGQRSIIYLEDKLKVHDVFIDHAHNRCFCDTCMSKRNDIEIYPRGDPPKRYALPRGWFRFGLRVPPKATALGSFAKWHVAYHGTSAPSITPILETGDLLMPGDKTAVKTITPPPGHFTKNEKPKDFNINQVFLSPTIKYSGCETYAKKETYEYPKKSGKQLSAQVGFQVRIKPGSYIVGPETVGAKKYVIDEHFKNKELEWSTDKRGVILLTGILVKIEDL